jgi:hypothetical protein
MIQVEPIKSKVIGDKIRTNEEISSDVNNILPTGTT